MEKRDSNTSSSGQRTIYAAESSQHQGGPETGLTRNPTTLPSGELNNRNETVWISIRDANLGAMWLEQISKLKCRPKVREFFFTRKEQYP